MNDLAIKTTAIKKAHIGGNMDFSQMIANYPLATPEHMANNQHQQTLLNLLQLLGAGNLIYIDSPISLDGEFIQAQGSIGLVLEDRQGQASNLLLYPPQGKPYLLQSFADDGLVLHGGDGSESIAVESIDIALQLASKLAYDENYTLIAPPGSYPRQFENLVKAFAKDRQITVFCDGSNSKDYQKIYDGHNVRLAVITDSLLNAIDDSGSLAGVLADELTIIKELGAFKWGVPEPLADDKSKATPYPIQAFTGVLREAVEAIAYHAQVPQAMAGQCVLGALSTIGQRYINAPIGHTHKPVSLFLITEGDSGSGKTFASGLSHHSLNQWDERIYKSYIELLNEWKTDIDSLKGKERKEYLQSNAKPVNKSMLIQEGTIEAILDQFILDDKSNLSWTTDDAGQFFNGHTMKGDTAGNAIASLAKLWDGSPVSRVRSQRGANPQYKTNAYNVRLTLDLQGQRIILEPALTDPMLVQQGFLARALLACPDSLQGSREWNTPERINNNPHDDPRLQAYWARCDILLDPLPSEIDTDLTGKEIRLDMPFENEQARQALADFQQRVENRQAKGNAYEFLRAFASRMAQNASRIASLMAFFDCQKSVSMDYLERAFMLVEYSTAERIRYLDIKSNEKNDSQKLIDWLVAKVGKMNPPKLNRTYVANSCPMPMPMPMPMQKNKRLLEQELEKLEQAGYIRQEMDGKKKVIFINPDLCK